MKYLKVWTNFRDVISSLTDAEIGRLFVAMLAYVETGVEPENFQGNERFLWATAKRDIDMTNAKNEILRQNGLKGGRPKTKENQTEPNRTKENQTEPNKSLKEKKGNEKKGNEMESSFMNDDEARAIQRDHDRLYDAAEDAGFRMSNSLRASLIRLYTENGMDKVLSAMDECVRHGASNLAYLEAVLKGKPKAAKPQVKVLNAQQYGQRDYAGVQDELIAEQDREMQEFMKRNIG